MPTSTQHTPQPDSAAQAASSDSALLGSVGSRVVVTITRSSLDHIRIVLRSTQGTVELGMTCEDLALALTGLAERPAAIARHTKQRLPNALLSEPPLTHDQPTTNAKNQ